jgi:hypothetical protein
VFLLFKCNYTKFGFQCLEQTYKASCLLIISLQFCTKNLPFFHNMPAYLLFAFDKNDFHIRHKYFSYLNFKDNLLHTRLDWTNKLEVNPNKIYFFSTNFPYNKIDKAVYGLRHRKLICCQTHRECRKEASRLTKINSVQLGTDLH